MKHSFSRRAFTLGAAAVASALGARRSSAETSIDGFVLNHMRAADIPGLAVGVARHGRSELARGYGFADVASRRRVTPDTLFHIASVTKTVTAAAVMMLVEEGRIGLDEPVGRYIDFPVVNPAFPHEPIRVRHLLMHTSSISEEVYQKVDFRVSGTDSRLPLRQFLRDLLVPGGAHYSSTESYAPTAPGTTWNYVNTGFALLGYLAGRVAGEDLRSYVDRRIFKRLGIKHAAWRLGDVPAGSAATPYDDADGKLVAVAPMSFPDWPAGMLRASISDFTRFIAACGNGGEAMGARLLRPETVSDMLAMKTPAGLPTWLSGQGLCWQEAPLAGSRLPNHWGGDPGVFTAAYLAPRSRGGVAIFTNATATAARRDAVKSIAAFLLERHGLS